MLKLTRKPALLVFQIPDYADTDPSLLGLPDGWYYSLNGTRTVIGPAESYVKAVEAAEAHIKRNAQAQEDMRTSDQRYKGWYRTRVLLPGDLPRICMN
jgi:hypothetical protein